MKSVLAILGLASIIVACNFEETQKPEDLKEETKKQDYEVTEPQIIGFYELADRSSDSKIVSLDLHRDSTFIAWKKVDDRNSLQRMTGTWKVRASVIKLIVNGKTDSKLSIEQLGGEEKVYNKLENSAKDVSEPFISKGKYFYMADAATFILCNSNDIYTVFADEVALEVEKKFLNIKDEFKESFYVEAVLSIETKENMEGNPQKQVVFHEIIKVDVNVEGCD